jgi:hypothetical protein
MQVFQSNVAADGGVNSVVTAQWDNSSITAGWVGSIATTGNAALGWSGDFCGNVELTGVAVPARKATLSSVNVAGNLWTFWDVRSGFVGSFIVRGTVYQSFIRSAGDISSITIGASDGSSFGAGVTFDVLLSDRHVAVGDATNTPTGTIKTFTVKGWRTPAGQPIPRFFADSTISAKVGSVGLLNWDGLGGLFAPSGGVKLVRHTDTADKWNSWVWPVPRTQVSGGPDDFIHII